MTDKADIGQVDQEWDSSTRTLKHKVESKSILELTRSGATVRGDLTVTGDIAGTIGASDLELTGEARGDVIRRGATDWERISAKDSGKILVGDGNDIVSVAVSGDATLAANGALTVADVTVGSDAAGDLLYKSSATALARLAKGTAGQVLQMNSGATAPQWASISGDAAIGATGAVTLTEEGIAQRAFSEDFNALDTVDQVSIILPSGLVGSGATGVMNHLYSPGGKVYCIASLGAGQTLFPSIVAGGLDIGGDQTDDEGWEIFSHFGGATGRPFIVGRDPAFYFTCKIEIGNADGIDHLMVGLRRAAPHIATRTDILDCATFGCDTAADPLALKLLTTLNGTDTSTDTTQTLAVSGAGTVAVQFKVLVSAAGVVTFQHDAVTPGTLAAPTQTVALTLDDGDPVIPFARFLNVAAFATNVIIHSWDAGYQ